MPTDITLSGSLHGLSMHNLSLDQLEATSGSSRSGSVRYLTPEAMLAYCKMNLDDIDGQVTKFTEKQKQNLEERKAFQSVTDYMQLNFGANGPDTHEKWQGCA